MKDERTFALWVDVSEFREKEWLVGVDWLDRNEISVAHNRRACGD
jgi:hypothetical protein